MGWQQEIISNDCCCDMDAIWRISNLRLKLNHAICARPCTPHTAAVQPTPFLFGRICFVVLVMRKGGESSWSGPWHLGCTLEVFHVHSYQDQFIQPGWAECFFCVFSLGLCFVCSFVLFDLFVCPHSFMFPWAVESSALQVLALA